ncbi:MAG: S-layer protein [Candidatus Micrarchaeaceae archaeon]
MKRLNAKKIAAVVTGAALLGFGLAFASPVTISNVQIINNAGQPVVQVVVGSLAKPSDGVAAGNIAAAIGNLAFTQTQKVFPANVTQAKSVLGVSVSSPSYTLTDQQVYFNETSSSVVSGAYSFSALIGSVLNRGVKLSSPISTKSLSSSTYAYPETYSITSSPAASAYSGPRSVPVSSVSGSYNGGGVSFTTFTRSSNDNILRVTNSNLPSLLNNYGTYGENEYLWLTGFPVYDQASGVDNFALLSAGGAYQVTFNKPINARTSSNAINNAQIMLLGQPWTIINSTYPTTNTVSTNVIYGGKISLASSLTNLSTVYVGDNLTSGPFKVQLSGLGNTNQSGVSEASINIYYQNSTTPVNTSVVKSFSLSKFNVSGHNLWVKVNQTFVGGSFSYQRWAKMQLYANVYNVTNSQAYNKTYNPGWNVYLGWTNATGTGIPNALQSIVIYNTTPTTLLPGQSFNFITSPAMWKLQFVGQTLSSGSYDPVSATLSAPTGVAYENNPSNTIPAGNINNITEPAQELTVTSSIPNAFSYAGQTSKTVTYDLTPYQLIESGNATSITGSNTVQSVTANVVTTFTDGNYVSSTYPISITVSGAASKGSGITTLYSNSIDGPGPIISSGFTAYNITSISLSRAIPGANIIVYNGVLSSSNTLATLNSITPQILYTQSGKNYLYNTSAANVIYNQQNGQPTTVFSLSTAKDAPKGNTLSTSSPYFEYTMNEIAVPSQTSEQDQLAFDIYNSTAGAGANPLFQLNQSTTGTRNNMTYISTQGTSIQVPTGFVTERGSKVASISQHSVTVDFAKSVDGLQFVVGPSSNVSVVKHFKIVGPVGIGDAVPNVPNVTVANVTAKISLSGTSSYNITGISKVVSMPENVTTPVLLKNLPTNPLVVLDTGASPHGSEILIGSGYVNTLSAAFEKAQGITNADLNVTGGKIMPSTATNQILVAGYTAAQTTAAANTFISDLYTAAASS